MSDGKVSERVEFASSEWLGLARSFLESAVPALGDSLEGVRFTVCEVFTSPPAHIAGGEPEVSWHVIVDGPTVSVGRGRLARADYFAKLDYEVARPLARTIYSDNPSSDAVMLAPLDDPAADGPPAVPAIHQLLAPTFRDLHDYLARRTR